jgi:simple sugar transport system permease protein
MRRLTAATAVGGSFLLALCVLALALALLGRRPDATLYVLLEGAFGSGYGLSETLLRTVPILLCALAAAIPAEGGQINIGGEGQFHFGAIGAVLLAWWASGNVFGVLLMLIGAVLFGGAWGAIPGALKAFVGINEALTSLFLNYVAIYFLQFLVHGPLRDPGSLGWPMSPTLPSGLQLGTISGTRLHAGIFVAVAVALLVMAFSTLTRAGMELKAVGLNPQASATLGIRVLRYVLFSMIVGGGLAGLAGYYEVAAVQHRLRSDMSLGFGYSGFLVAWMCRGQFWLILPLSILIAGLVASSENLQIMAGLPAASSDVAQGFLLLFVVLSRPMLARLERRRSIRLAMEATAYE